MESPAFWMAAGARLVVWLSLLWLGGVAVWRLAIEPGPADRTGPGPPPVAVATVLLAAKLLELWLQARGFFRPDPVGLDELWLVAGSTAWGFGWSLQVLAAAALVVATALLPLSDRGWPALAIAAVAGAAFEPLTGHAADAGRWSWPWLLQSAHVLGAILWIGGLALLVAHLRRAGEGAPDPATVRDRVESFSPIALTGAGLLVVSGGLTAWEYTTTLSQLWETSWGRALGLKLLLVGSAAALGAWNWRRLRPRLGTVAATDRLRRFASLELALAILALTVSAVLVALSMPAG